MVKRSIDLSTFKVQNKGLLDKTEEATAVEKKLDQVIKQNKTKKSQARAGRPPIPNKERKTKAITLKFTQSQFDLINSKAGDIPLAIYLLRRLEQTDLFKTKEIKK